MNKYLFTRTDRIGDFLLSAILLNSIKRNDKKSHITIIASNKNYEFIKTINFIDEVIIYPNSLTDKIKFFFNFFKKKFFFVGILDGKKRSIYLSFLLKSNIKILCTYKYVYKILFLFFFNKVILDNESDSKLIEIKSILSFLNFRFEESDLNILNKNIFHTTRPELKSYNFKYDVFHFDEKWIYKEYIKTYQNIEPNNSEELMIFIKKIISITNKNLIITTGNKQTLLLDKIKSNFTHINNNYFELDVDKNKILLLKNLSFVDLSLIIKNSDLLISCHGAPTHIAAAYNSKIIDIIDDSEKLFFSKWSSHFRNYKSFSRENFKDLSNKILNFLPNEY